MIMTDFQAYKMYLALKAHFQTDNYDVIAMQGRIRASRKTFFGHKSLMFQKLVKQYSDDEICNFMVSNFIAGNHWGGVFDLEASKKYAAWKRRMESLRYTFKQDLLALRAEAEEAGVADWFAAPAGQHPLILKAFLRNSITPETLVILNKLTGFADQLQLDDPVWPDIRRMIIKYSPFVKIDRASYQELLHETE